jgi:hypothetical protein
MNQHTPIQTSPESSTSSIPNTIAIKEKYQITTTPSSNPNPVKKLTTQIIAGISPNPPAQADSPKIQIVPGKIEHELQTTSELPIMMPLSSEIVSTHFNPLDSEHRRIEGFFSQRERLKKIESEKFGEWEYSFGAIGQP